ncbi:MAG: hypothetical protein II956_05715 [Bacteroidales bacterium]|nr:hypothetical protein [Bacteroidales bacterium]
METKVKSSVMRCWELAKDLNNSEKFELSFMLMESIKSAFTASKQDDEFDIEDYEKNLRPYTMDEINAIIDEAEADIAAGRMIPDEEAWNEEELALMGKDEPDLAMAV